MAVFSEDDNPPLLSEVLLRRGGCLTQEEAESFFKCADDFLAIDEANQTLLQKGWLKDYTSNIKKVVYREREMRVKESEACGRRFEGDTSPPRMSTFRVPSGYPPRRPLPPVPGATARGGREKSLWGDIEEEPGDAMPTIKLNELVIKPEKFDGNRHKAREWLEEFEAAAEANNWQERVTLRYFPTFLVKEARQWFVSFILPSLGKESDWLQARQAFVRFYLGPNATDAAKDELRKARQMKGELATQFIPRMAKLFRLANISLSDEEATREIRVKMRDEYQDFFVGRRVSTLTELNDICLEVEERFHIAAETPKLPSTSGARAGRRSNFRRERQGVKGEVADEKSKRLCTYCNGRGHTVDYCWKKRKDQAPVKEGKSVSKPRAAAPVEARPASASSAPTRAIDPPKPKVVTLKNGNVCSVVGATTEPAGDIMHPIKLNNEDYLAMIDTGSRLTLISAKTAKALRVVGDGSDLGLVGANGQPLSCRGYVELELSIVIGPVKKIVTTHFAVVDNLCVDVLLGNKLLGWLGIAVSAATRSIFFENEPVGMRVKEAQSIPPRTQAVVDVVLPACVDQQAVLAVPLLNNSQLLIANTVDWVEDSKARCLVANLSENVLSLPRGLQLATFEVIGKVRPPELILPTVEMEIGGHQDHIKVGSQLGETETQELLALIESHLEAFSIEGSLGDCKVIEHDIELIDNAKGVVEPLRRRPKAHQAEAAKQVAKMLDMGIIEPSASSRAAAYVLVKKKDGTLRMCIDFRRLNDQTKKNLYPLPNLDDCIESLAGNKYYSQLDLASGYWQVRMAEKAKELTAFRTEEGVFQFRRLPFGLCNAPASFQRLMNALFGGLRGLQLQTFIDDLCVATRTWQEHLSLLEEIFGILIRSNLKLKPEKCTFGSSRVIFLGHELSAEGIKQDPAKSRAIVSLADPREVKELQRFLGLFNFYRKFIPNFAQTAAPLYRLLRKGEAFLWGTDQQAAANALRKALESDITLAHFNDRDPVMLKTDASGVGVAGLLLQRQGDDWRIITCCSRRLSKAEANYGISDLEGLAIVYSATKLRSYLLGRHFTILTDHCALCALKLKMPASARLRRWALILQEFDFEIRYVKGSLHSDVDCLSRAPVDGEVDAYMEGKVLNVRLKAPNGTPEVVARAVAIDSASWAEETANDEEGRCHLGKARARTKGYRILNGLLYFEDRLFVPTGRRQALLEASHADPPACHGGVRATAGRLAAYWWPKMSEDVRTFIRDCEICSRRKVERAKPLGSMSSFETYEPFQLMAVDALGPLPPCVSDERHVFVAVDSFTRFVFAEAAHDVQGVTAASFLRNMIGVLGVPKVLLSDNAPTFCNTEVRTVLEEFGVEHRLSTPQHHEGNAQVERLIQTLQEKLSLIIHDPACTVDWKAALPTAVLSLNTTVHQSTGYSPFELMFGRAHWERSELTTDESSLHGSFAELRERRAAEAHANALAANSDAQGRAQTRFNERRRQLVFEQGDSVYVRQAGRVTKLQNRFAGPYTVVERTDDVYKVERVLGSRKEVLRRHVADLKLCRRRTESRTEDPVDLDSQEKDRVNLAGVTVASLMNLLLGLALLICARPSHEEAFVEAPLVSWRQMPANVSPRLTTFHLGIFFRSPCGALRQFQPPELREVEVAVAQCDSIFRSQIGDKLATFASWHASQPQVRIPTAPNHIGKRSLTDVVIGAFASNVLATVVDRIWPNGHVSELERRAQLLDQQTQALNSKLNFTAMEISALRDGQQILAKLVENNIQVLDAIKTQYPRLAVVASDVINRIHLLASLIERSAASMRAGHPDLVSLYQIFGYESLLELDASSLFPESCRISVTAARMLVVELAGHRRSVDTAAYRVVAFNHFANLLEDPVYMEYTGPHYVVYNSTSNCAQPIATPTSHSVEAFCEVTNYQDESLVSWRRIAANQTEAIPQVEEMYPFYFVYCYKNNITISNSTQSCPPYAFQLHVSTPFAVGKFHYTMELARFRADNAPILAIAAARFHLRQDNSHIDKTRAIQRVLQLNDQVAALGRAEIAIQIGPLKVTHRDLAIGNGALALLAFAAFGGIYIYYKLGDKRDERRNHRLATERIKLTQRRASESARQLREIYEIPNGNRVRELPLAISWRPF